MTDTRNVEIALVVDKKVVSASPIHPRLIEIVHGLIDGGLYGNTSAEALARCVERHLDVPHKEV